MSRIDELHPGWMRDLAYRKEYDALVAKFARGKAPAPDRALNCIVIR